jgi:ABC-type lipoprotein export system ATPase subunit
MVTPTPPDISDSENLPSSLYIRSFYVAGGIFGGGHNILFPTPPNSGAEPGVLILSGKNGSGKTTILRMISEVLDDLNFNTYRRIPFSNARLEFSDGNFLAIDKVQDDKFPLVVRFGEVSAQLYKERHSGAYSPEQQRKITEVKNLILPLIQKIKFELLDIHRSSALKRIEDTDFLQQELSYQRGMPAEVRNTKTKELELSSRVRNFMRDAQVNYRRFFAAEGLELLPRIIERFSTQEQNLPTREELLRRVSAVKDRFTIMKRFGLQTDDADLETLHTLLEQEDRARDSHSLTLLEAYVEMQENRQKARELVATRLLEFEAIIDEFLQGKNVRISAKSGLQIVTDGETLPETDLSSGEYHFLYMMVTALLCQRSGTIIAIDEPELSLHVTWQRKLIRALARCASGASPVFLFATHSPAIAAEYSDREYSLSSIE